jgi:nicotinate-nucleotide--dimethylbenzimidazole phosphoribosyltransferase
VLARQHGIALTVADCGVRHDFLPAGGPASREGLVVCKIGAGTADAFVAPAMTPEQCAAAVDNGRALLRSLPGNVLLLGEMGIGNTSAASLLQARLTGLDIAECTGSGTGLDAAAVVRKAQVLRAVLLRHEDATEPLAAMQAFGGFEMATMLGAVWQAAEENRVILVDGYITTAVVLVAQALAPAVLQRCVFAHRSGEAGHAALLAHLGAEPLLDLGLRLGEGSGAALAWPLLVSACAVLREMASFASAGVSQKESGC